MSNIIFGSDMINGEYYHLEQYEGPDSPFKAGVYEGGTLTCAHCQSIVLLNPERRRGREKCRTGNHYLCDACYAILDKTGCMSAQHKMDLAVAHPESLISIGMVRPTSDLIYWLERTKPYVGITLPRKDQ